MNIQVVCPMWQNHELTRQVFSSWARWEYPGVSLRFKIVGSEGLLSRECCPNWFDYIERPNQPLGAKFNAGIESCAGDLWWDYVCIIGSDQVAHAEIWHEVSRLNGEPYIGAQDTFVADIPTNKVIYWPGYTGDHEGRSIGPFRCVRRDWVEALDFAFYDPKPHSLDSTMDARLPPCRLFESRLYGNTKIGTASSLTPFSAYGRLPAVAETRNFLTTFGIDVSKVEAAVPRH